MKRDLGHFLLFEVFIARNGKRGDRKTEKIGGDMGDSETSPCDSDDKVWFQLIRLYFFR